MLRYVDGDLLRAPVQTLVNPVNTVGVMGAGLAKQFATAYPEMYEGYRELCRRHLLRGGMLWLYRGQPKWILCLPTKTDWRYRSTVDLVERGLEKFVMSYATYGITSAAFPMLGCGLGGLGWHDQVRPLMERRLADLPIDVLIYGAPGEF